jgi:copper homeostasis protein
MQRPLIEVCVSSVADAVEAAAVGADRIELCSALEVGGLTPSAALLESVVEMVSVPIMAMIRPRLGGFHYKADEFCTAIRDAEWALKLGAAGIVFGFLDADGSIDAARCRELVALAGARDTVFHRAFDFVPDPRAASDILMELGVKRLLTSGQRATAIEGADLIRKLVDRTAGTLEVMPGGGIRPDNVVQICERTGCNQVHLGAARVSRDKSLAGNPQISMIAYDQVTNNTYRSLDVELLKNVVQVSRQQESAPSNATARPEN